MSPSPAAGISVRDLTKSYGPVAALRGVSFDVAPGEILGLLGPNGAGKTTAIECALGLRRPDAGSVRLDGIDALAQPGAARRRVGAQLQSAALPDQLTPRQALGLFAAFYPEPAPVEELLGRFSLAAKAGDAFATLSAGQRQRLNLALAFVNRPRLVFLDEPTAGLDPQARRELHARLGEARAAGCAILLSTHDLAEAQSLCDRVGILCAGRLVALDSPAALLAGARMPSRLSFRTARPFAAAALPGVTTSERQGDGWLVATGNINRTISGLALALEAAGNELLGLEIRSPTLEDVFFELTGQPWMAVEAAALP